MTNKYVKLTLLLSIIILICSYIFLVIHHLGQVPNMFLDEVNYAAEVQSFHNFGTDIHGLRFPIYFTSLWGQGQSVLYALLAQPIIALLGFNIFSFRLTMVIWGTVLILLVTTITYIISKKLFLTLTILVSLISSPWIYMTLRWVLDCNIAPIILSIGIWLFIYFSQKNNFTSIVNQLGKILGIALITLSAYGYITFWLYLPILFLALTIYTLKNKLVSIHELLLYAFIILIIGLPLLIFAINVFFFHSDQPTKFLFFDIPILPSARTSSFISLSPHIIQNILKNLFLGLEYYILGNDHLPWNSIEGFGVVSPVMLLFSLIGLFTDTSNWGKFKNFADITKLQLLTFLPLTLVIIPNYNHWNPINFPLAILSGIGLYNVISTKTHLIKLITLITPIVIFAMFLNDYWSPTSFSKNGMFNYTVVSTINKKVGQHKLYISNLSKNVSEFKLVKNVSPEYYNEHQDHLGANHLAPKYYFDNLRDISLINQVKHGDYILVSQADASVVTKHYQYISNCTLDGENYTLYEVTHK